MPPGIRHDNWVCWDDLETPAQAKLIGFHQTAEHVRAEQLSRRPA
jgi:hypothetical protein